MHLVNSCRCPEAVLPLPQIKNLKFAGVAGTKLWMLQVHSPYPPALGPKRRNKMMTDKPTCAGYQHPSRITHYSLLGLPNEFHSISLNHFGPYLRTGE